MTFEMPQLTEIGTRNGRIAKTKLRVRAVTAVGVTPLRSDVLPSEELAGNAAPIVGAYAVIP